MFDETLDVCVRLVSHELVFDIYFHQVLINISTTPYLLLSGSRISTDTPDPVFVNNTISQDGFLDGRARENGSQRHRELRR